MARDREALLDELAGCLARAAVDDMLDEVGEILDRMPEVLDEVGRHMRRCYPLRATPKSRSGKLNPKRRAKPGRATNQHREARRR